MIVVDSREASTSPKLVEVLKKKMEVRIEPLEAGDYYIPGNQSFLVERKTVGDFVASVRDGRLWGELEKMKSSNAGHPFLLVEGPLGLIEKFTNWNPASVAGLLLSVEDGWGVPILWSQNAVWTHFYLVSMVNRAEREEGKEYCLSFAPKRVEPERIQLTVVSSLPGVGPEKAKKLLEHFGTLRKFFSASEEELREVKGIGEKISKELTRLFDLNFEEK